MQQPRWTWSTLVIVTATVALVFGPVFIPREVSRWYLAAAANAFRTGHRQLGQSYLERAMDWDSSVVGDRDFWIAQMDNTNSDEVLELLKKAIETDPRSAAMAQRIALVFIEEFDFQRAVRALKMAFPDGKPWEAEDLNFLAYLRAQAGVELDQALKDINRALDMAGDEPAMLDTKAWVLHGMGRDLEALGIINDAITGMEAKLKRLQAEQDKKKEAKPAAEASDNQSDQASDAEQSSPPDQADAVDSTQLHEPSSETEQLRKRIQVAKARLGLDKWSLAVLRFHRLRICEALHQRAEARTERQWLMERGVPIVDELF